MGLQEARFLAFIAMIIGIIVFAIGYFIPITPENYTTYSINFMVCGGMWIIMGVINLMKLWNRD